MIDPRTQALKEHYSPDGSPLRDYQIGLLDLLVKIDNFCRSNGVEYSLSAGTLLGAMRHEGFIPWDDDADTMMTRENFDKLKSFCDENGKLCDGLYIKQNIHYIFDNGKNIVDIFVEDYCPNSKLLAWIKLTSARIVGLMIKCKFRIVYGNWFKPFKPWCVLVPFACIFNLKHLQRSIQSIAKWFNSKPSKYLSCYSDSIKDMGHKYPSEMFDGYMDVVFEGHTFSVIKNYEMQLTELYGDWRRIPDEKDRVWLARVESDVKIKRK